MFIPAQTTHQSLSRPEVMIMEHFNALSWYLYEGTECNYKILSVYALFFHQYSSQEKQNYLQTIM
jgi:hypothetical protein